MAAGCAPINKIIDLGKMVVKYIKLPRSLSPALLKNIGHKQDFVSICKNWKIIDLFFIADVLSSIEKVLGFSVCLKRSIFLYQIFSAIGVSVELCIGVNKEKHQEGHAWVIVNSIPDLAPGIEEQFKVISKFHS